MSGTRLSEIQEALPPLREHRLERAPDLNTLAPVSSDIRRQLEGGIETLEAAHRRYVLLEKALQQKQWQHEVLTRLETLHQQVRQEPEVVEALSRLRQRARVEGWPDMEPALVLARKVEKLRIRLDALMRERLGGPTTRESFAEKLARLHQVLTQTIAPPVSSEERVLHQGDFEADAMTPMLPFLLMLGLIVAIAFGGILVSPLVWCVLLLTSVLPMPFLPSLWDLLESRRSGRFWLTGKRLVWQPTGREPIHIPLQAIRPDGVQLLSSRSVGVRLLDGRFFRFDFIEGTKQLVTLLEQHRPAPLDGESQKGT